MSIRPLNYDPALLEVQADIGNGTENILGQLGEISINLGVEQSTYNTSPMAGSATLRIGTEHGGSDFFRQLYQAPVTVTYDGWNLFVGNVRAVSTDVDRQPWQGASRFNATLDCLQRVHDLSRRRLVNFTAPQESGAARFGRLCTTLGLTFPGPYRYEGLTTFQSGPTIEPYTGDALAAFAELALAHRARFYVDPYNRCTLTSEMPTVVLEFDSQDPTKLDFTSVAFGSSDEQFVSRVIGILKRNESYTSTRTAPGAVLIRSEEFIVDVAGPTELATWTNSCNTQAFPPFVPVSLRTVDVQGIPWDDVQLTNLVTVKVPEYENVYTVGLTGVQHSITPRKWVADFSFCARHFVEPEDI